MHTHIHTQGLISGMNHPVMHFTGLLPHTHTQLHTHTYTHTKTHTFTHTGSDLRREPPCHALHGPPARQSCPAGGHVPPFMHPCQQASHGVLWCTRQVCDVRAAWKNVCKGEREWVVIFVRVAADELIVSVHPTSL